MRATYARGTLCSTRLSRNWINENTRPPERDTEKTTSKRGDTTTDRVSILDRVLRHPNEAILIGLVNFRKLTPIFPQLIGQFGSVQHAIGPSGLDHRALFADGEVLPLERRPHVLPEES